MSVQDESNTLADARSHQSISSTSGNAITVDGSVAPQDEKDQNSTTRAVAAPPASAPEPPPDGGLVAWVQVLGGFVLIFNCWGIVNTFGVFQTYYETTLPDRTASDISWIGSLEAFLLLTISVLAGPLYDHGYLRSLIISGSFLIVFGMMMLSLCEDYWQIMLTQGLLVGTGSGLLFLPSMAVLPSYFMKHRALATGLAMSGSGLGGIVYPIIFRQLQPSIGFGWATRAIGFIMLGTLVIPVVGMKMRVQPPGVRKMIELEAWKDVPYALLGAGAFFGFAGLYIPMFYIQTFALSNGITTDANLAFYLLPIINAASIFGRILPNILTDRIGVFNTYVPAAIICAILAFAWMAVNSLGGVLVFAVLYGFFSGTFLSLSPVAAVVLIIPNMSRLGVRMGMNFFVGALGLLIGTPIAGAIVRTGSWYGLQAFNGATLALAACFYVGVKVTKKGWNLEKI